MLKMASQAFLTDLLSSGFLDFSLALVFFLFEVCFLFLLQEEEEELEDVFDELEFSSRDLDEEEELEELNDGESEL